QGGILQIMDVWGPRLVQRSGNGDADRIDLGQTLKVGGRLEEPPVTHVPDPRRGDVVEVALALIEFGNLVPICIEAKDANARPGEGVSEGQTYITKTKDANTDLPSADGGEEVRERIGH